MDPIPDDGRMDCTEPQKDDHETEIATTNVCERPKESERDQGSIDEERPPAGVSDHTTVQPQEENERYERNLKKFLESSKMSLEIRSYRENNVTERLINSDGMVEKRVDYGGNASKSSSILTETKLKRSSAPPTYDATPRENPENKEIEVSMTETVGMPPGNSETPVSSRAKIVSEPNASDNSATPSRDFKTPVAPSAGATPGQASTPKSLFISPGSSKTFEDGSTPVLRRPTNFCMKPRKSFYTFTPEGSGILRQCQSMPNINRRQRKEEKRRSLVMEPENQSRVVRWLFVDQPGPNTPETGQSRVRNSHIPRPSREAVENETDNEGNSSIGNVKTNTCRKLTFADPDNTCVVAMEEEENTEDGKRKEISPPFAESPPAFAKKVRISPKPEEREDVGIGSRNREQGSNIPGEISEVPQESNASPVKRKSDEFSSSKKK